MNVTADTLSQKIKSFYPEIAKHGLALAVTDDPAKKAWMVEVAKGAHKLDTYVEYADARSCLDGKECVHLSTQIGQFVRNYCGESCAP